MTPPSAPTGRLAPSPTGFLHLGHARTFLIAWWSARSAGGGVWLRMEDLDRSRVRPGLADAILLDLEWLGLDWDGPVVRQSERGELYEAALARLVAEGRAYPCVCTRAEIERAQSAPHLEDGTVRYPSTCRGRFASLAAAEAATGRSPAVRFVVPEGRVEFEDRWFGRIAQDVCAEVGDFPIARRDGEPAYQLAVVVDDAEQGVTEVVRGRDLLSSTARQLLLQRSLGLPHPVWAHVPLVTDAAGRRLAKRHDDLSLARLRGAGVDPRRVVAWVAESVGLEPRGPSSPADRLGEFRAARVAGPDVVLDGAALGRLGLPLEGSDR